MTVHQQKMQAFTGQDIESFKPEMKIGMLATVTEEGLPHLTLISTLQASGPTQLFWGQFSEGRSKINIRKNPKAGFLIMTLDKDVWRGKATFTHAERSGNEFDILNETPMFRYNAYFGIHTVYYMDLVEQSGRSPLPMSNVIQAAIKTMVAKTLAGKGGKDVLNVFTRKMLDKLDNLKFLSYVGTDGYPVIIPVIQAQSAGMDRVIFSSSVYREDLLDVPAGATAALFCMSFEMQTVLLRGVFKGIHNISGFDCGEIDVNWVYNPMPPKMEQVYPPLKLEKIKAF
ncbi:MAG: pyridoxamine 5'-phosphate oxidase family protein [Dehalococcoidia bacterium]|nr:pyridoxamine 5'-phosphate oxidase family protein [Dehalococcoidia bacterium]